MPPTDTLGVAENTSFSLSGGYTLSVSVVYGARISSRKAPIVPPKRTRPTISLRRYSYTEGAPEFCHLFVWKRLKELSTNMIRQFLFVQESIYMNTHS
mmetsp:Transcript_127156/g.249151  ORF Transcript_127156/g.249151 Transcript_127156/m.249151 type:complete len:98 (+) Transcript_127156:811-1104(+)